MLFVYVATVAFLMTLFALYRMTRRKPVPLDNQTDFVAVTPTAGVAALDPRTEIEPYEEAFEAEQTGKAEATTSKRSLTVNGTRPPRPKQQSNAKHDPKLIDGIARSRCDP